MEKLLKLTNNYSTIIMRPRGMRFQLSAHFCYLCAYTSLPRHMKEQIVVYIEQIWIFWKDFTVFWRFPTKRFPSNFDFLSISFSERSRRFGQILVSWYSLQNRVLNRATGKDLPLSCSEYGWLRGDQSPSQLLKTIPLHSVRPQQATRLDTHALNPLKRCYP